MTRATDRSRRRLASAAFACAAGAWLGLDSAGAQPPSGELVYGEHCALCHEQVDERIPHRSALQQMSAARIVRALDAGAMLAIAMSMNRDERDRRRGVSRHRRARRRAAGRGLLCRPYRDARGRLAPELERVEPGTGQRALSTSRAYARQQVPRLALAWAFGFAGDVTAFAAPTVSDGHMFVGSASGLVQALAADSGCIKWTWQANGPVRAAPIAAERDDGHVLLFGDLTGWFYAVDAATGELVWKTQHRDARFDATHGRCGRARRRRVRARIVVGRVAGRRSRLSVLHVPRQRRRRARARRRAALEDLFDGRSRASSVRTAPARRSTGRRARPSGRRRPSTRRAASYT